MWRWGCVANEAADVGIEHPVHPLPLDAHRQRVQRLMRAATGPEPVREALEVDLSSKNPRTLRNNMHENREISCTSWSVDQDGILSTSIHGVTCAVMLAVGLLLIHAI